MIKVFTDTDTDITLSEANELDLGLISMPYIVEGNPIYPFVDYKEYDYILGMEQSNIRGILRICGGDPQGKVHRLLDYSDSPRDIADPWYTGNFDRTYDDIVEGCQAFYKYLEENGIVESW